MSKNKISIYLLHLKLGGVESYNIMLANMLADKYDVELVVFYDYGKPDYEIDEKVKIIYLTNLRSNRERVLKKIKNRGFPGFKDAILAFKILFLRRWLVKKHIRHNEAKVIISSRLLFHDLIANHGKSDQVKICQEHSDHKDDQKYIRRVIKATRKANYLMPTSKFLVESYQDFISSERPKITQLQHAVKTPLNHDYRPNKKIISVGRLSSEKGFVDMIDVFAKVYQKDKQYSLLIIGDGNEKESLLAKIKELKLMTAVKLAGPLSHQEALLKMCQAGLYVMTSFEESFGLVLIEAMACGLPLLAFDSARGAQEIIKDQNGVLIADRDVDKMAMTIVNLSDQQKLVFSKNNLISSHKYDYAVVKQEVNSFMGRVIREG